MSAINENLKLLRQSNGMTQLEVADIIAVSRQTISSYESGRTQPDLETLKRLADVYCADLHDVFYGGNRLQRQKKQVKRIAYILIAVILTGILVHSFILLMSNIFFQVADGTVISSDNRVLIDMRFTLRKIAETVVGVCTVIFSLGCIIMVFPIIKIIRVQLLFIYKSTSGV